MSGAKQSLAKVWLPGKPAGSLQHAGAAHGLWFSLVTFPCGLLVYGVPFSLMLAYEPSGSSGARKFSVDPTSSTTRSSSDLGGFPILKLLPANGG